MPPGKDRENLHVSLPSMTKKRLVDEATRRNISTSDLVIEYIDRATRQDEQWRLDLQRILELNSQKSDRILVQIERLCDSLELPQTPPSRQSFRYMDIIPVPEVSSPVSSESPVKGVSRWWKKP